MSGGSLDYAYTHVDEAAGRIASRSSSPLHHAFAAHLRLVAKAMHDLEWVWSSDTSPGDEEAAIRACIEPDAELVEAMRMLEATILMTQKTIERANKILEQGHRLVPAAGKTKKKSA